MICTCRPVDCVSTATCSPKRGWTAWLSWSCMTDWSAFFGVRLSAAVLETALTPADWLRGVLDARGAVPVPGEVAVGAMVGRAAGEPWPTGAETLIEALSWHVGIHPDLVTIRILLRAPGEQWRTSRMRR